MLYSSNVRLGQRWFGLLGCGAALLLLAGCGSGGSDAKNQVTGKVTMDGKPVSGTLVFVTSDNKEFTSPIGSTDGHYQVIEVPNGTAKIMIKSMNAGGPALKTPDGKAMPDMGGGGATAPAKYGSVATSGLSLEVKGGKQTHDITLTP